MVVVIVSLGKNDVNPESVFALYEALFASIFERYNSDMVAEPT